MESLLVIAISVIAGAILSVLVDWLIKLWLPEKPAAKHRIAGFVVVFILVFVVAKSLTSQANDPVVSPPTTTVVSQAPNASPTPPIATNSPLPMTPPSPSPTLILLPTETLTPPPAPTLRAGQDFEVGCIDSKYWTPYKAERRPRDFNGCWDLSTMGISAQDGGLVIAADNVEGYTRSLYTALPANAEVQFKVRIDKLSTVREVDSNVVFGIGNAEQWLLRGKYLIYRVISPKSPVYLFYTDSVLHSGETFFPNYTYGQEQQIVFDIHGLLLDLYVNNSKVLESIPLLPSDKEVFWIGSWVSNNGSIQVTLKDFRVIAK